MNTPVSTWRALAFGALFSPALLSPTLFATTMTSLSSFGGIEEPVRIYHPSSNSFTTDSFANITNVSSGTIQTLLRYSTSAWDGDRSTGNTDRGRAEVKTLGPNQKIHETFDYTTTWRTNSGFKGSGGFCHITQLKGTNGTEGSSGAPLVVTSINSGTSSAIVRYASTSFSPHNVFSTRVARNISWSPNTWLALKIRIRTTSDGGSDGIVQASVNGDALQGVTNVEVSRPEATNYYPKWGLYRKQTTSSGFSANDYIQHSNVSANLVTGTPPPATLAMEAEALSKTTSGPTVTTGNDSSASGGVITYFNSTAAGQWVQYTTPSVQAGTYQIKFRYKRNTARGQHTLKVDGTQVGGTINEYGTNGYVEVTVGNVTFGSTGTHTIRLTVTGKTSSSTSFVLAPDRFTFTGQ